MSLVGTTAIVTVPSAGVTGGASSSSTSVVLRADQVLTSLEGAPKEGAQWLGRIVTHWQAHKTEESAWSIRDLPVLGRLASALTVDPRVASREALRGLLLEGDAHVASFLEGAGRLAATHQFALRLFASRALVTLAELKSDRAFASEAFAINGAIDRLKVGLGITTDYEYIARWFGPFSEMIQMARPSEYLLIASDERIGLMPAADYDRCKPNRIVSRQLAALYTRLSGAGSEAVFRDLHPFELIALYCLFNRMVLNYIAHQDMKMDLHFQILSSCDAIRRVLQVRLDSLRESNASSFVDLWRAFQSSYKGLEAIWGEAQSLGGYPRDFLTNPVHHEVLVQLIQDNLEIYRKVISKSTVTIPGLTFIAADDEAGFRVYHLPARDGAVERLLLAVQTLTLEDWRTHYDPRKAKVAARFGVVGHQAVIAAADEMYARFEVLIARESAKAGLERLATLPMTAVGFGLDGAVAQLMAHQWKREHPLAIDHPKNGHIALGFGVPRYLEIDSAALVGCRGLEVAATPHCLYSLNFVNAEDTRIFESAWSSLVAPGSYSDENFNIYPLVDKVSMALDLTRHSAEDYIFNIDSALGIPTIMYTQCQQLYNTLESGRKMSGGTAVSSVSATALALDGAKRSSDAE